MTAGRLDIGNSSYLKMNWCEPFGGKSGRIADSAIGKPIESVRSSTETFVRCITYIVISLSQCELADL